LHAVGVAMIPAGIVIEPERPRVFASACAKNGEMPFGLVDAAEFDLGPGPIDHAFDLLLECGWVIREQIVRQAVECVVVGAIEHLDIGIIFGQIVQLLEERKHRRCKRRCCAE